MSLFKILKGASSRISTAITPFTEGYAYFTPDDGGFYIDAKVGEQEKRIRINPERGNPTSSVPITIKSNGWKGNKQTVKVDGLGQIQNGILGLSHDITLEQREAICEANLRLSNQKNGSIDFVCEGDIPTVDIPLVMILMSDNGSGSKTTYGTLLNDRWISKRQTIAVGGIDKNSNGVISAPNALTADQVKAFNDADLSIVGQDVESLTISCNGKKPDIDLPVAIVIFD